MFGVQVKPGKEGQSIGLLSLLDFRSFGTGQPLRKWRHAGGADDE